MAVARAWSVALVGLDGRLVEVEADLAAGLPATTIVGLPDATVHESRDRVRAAVVNSGEAWPPRRITLGLSPAGLPKRGSWFDLALAVAVLAAAGVVPVAALAGLVLLGELALDGRVRPVRGVLPATLAAARAGIARVVVPAGNAAEAALVPDVAVHGVRSLRGLLGLLRGEPELDDEPAGDEGGPPGEVAVAGEPRDLADVLGQDTARQAIEVAAAGGHHVLLVGPPGAGKTMLAERLPGLLPVLDPAAALEVTAIHSLAGALPGDSPLVTAPPFRSPHHSASVPALVGGGAGVARPGEISLAHRGILFLDEAPEFSRRVLDALRQPLESGSVAIARAGGMACYPARFGLVLAANPCPCSGRVVGRDGGCVCTATVRRRYTERLSGPLLDRIDLRLVVWPVSRADLIGVAPPESTAVVADRVAAARDRAARRLRDTPWRCNAEVPGPVLRSTWPLPAGALVDVESGVERGTLSGRGMTGVLRTAWTLADLAGRDLPDRDAVATALALRDGTAW